jgi:hypothetical protein
MAELCWSGPKTCECGNTIHLGIMSLIGVCECGRAYVETSELKGWFPSRDAANEKWRSLHA